MKNEPGIYSIANTVTGVVYVGAAQNLYRREYHHRWALKLSRDEALKQARRVSAKENWANNPRFRAAMIANLDAGRVKLNARKKAHAAA